MDFWAECWIGTIFMIVLSSCLFSVFSLMGLGARLGALCALCWTIFRVKQTGSRVFAVCRFRGIGWGIPVLVIMCLASLLAGPHSFLDSYSYRFPQMFFWIQEGHPWSIPYVDGRINQMPHVWPMLSAAFYLILGERAVAIPNFIGLLLLVALFRRWAAGNENSPTAKSDAIALIFISAPVFLMGASTNDNVVTACSLLATSYHFANRRKASFRTVVLSALAFVLTCGLKPQYLVLAPIWMAWFCFDSSRPWRTVGFKGVVCLVPVLILCSPIPTMIVNQFRWGSFTSPEVVYSHVELNSDNSSVNEEETARRKPGRIFRTLRGKHAFTSLGIQLFSPPLNPFYAKTNKWIQTGRDCLATRLRQHGLNVHPMVIADSASLSSLATLALLTGLLTVFWRDPRSLLFAVPLTLLMAFALAYTNGGTVGRSFSGFFVLLFPAAMHGLERFSKWIILPVAATALSLGFSIIVLDPAMPLFPVDAVIRHLPSESNAARVLGDYAKFHKRQHAVRSLMEAIPLGEKRIGVKIDQDNPFGEIWIRRPGVHVVPYAELPDATTAEHDGITWIVEKTDSEVAANPPEGFALVKTSMYVSRMSKGAQEWKLWKIEKGI